MVANLRTAFPVAKLAASPTTDIATMMRVSTALDVATPTLRDVAAWMDTSYHTVRSWRLGNRAPAPTVQQRLARALRKHGNRVLRAADQLERAARRQLGELP